MRSMEYGFGGLALWMIIAITAPLHGADWKQYQSPEAAGWSEAALERARVVADEAGSAAVMVVEDGVVVAAWGQIDRPFPLYSMRKGIYDALVGILVGEGKIDLDATLEELGIDDEGGLSDVEKSATVEDLLVSRSGIYHESAYEPGSMKRDRPERGSHAPGEHWFYNNWDFNLVAHLIGRAGGASLADQLRERLAEPLGMEDYSDDDAFTFLEPSRSRYPAEIFRISARDIARIGQLFLQGGIWEGKRILPADWIEKSWTAHVVFGGDNRFGAGNGFGYLWWIYPAEKDASSAVGRVDGFVTRGAGGQVLAVVPSLDLVFVHLTDTENGMGRDFPDAVKVLEAVLEARATPKRADELETTAVDAVPLANAHEPPVRHVAIEWPGHLFEELKGTYALNPQVSIEVYELEGRLFGLPKGVPLAEVELFIDEDGVIFSPAVDLALEVESDDEGRVTSLRGRMEGRSVRIVKAVGAAD